MKKLVINSCLIFTILITSLLAYLFINNGNEIDVIANIFYDNQLMETIDLSEFHEETEYIFVFDEKEITFILDYNKIKVLNVDCPQEICKHQGFITLETEMIICMPNKVLVTLSKKV